MLNNLHILNILHIFAELNLIIKEMIVKEQFFVNEEANVAVVRYTDLMNLLSENVSLNQQVKDMGKVLATWEALTVFGEVFIEEDNCECTNIDLQDYISVDELFDTVPYELMY